MSSLFVSATPAGAVAGGSPTRSDPLPSPQIQPSEISREQRDVLLPKNWRTSSDIAWATSGDISGFHVLAAKESEGYAWRTVTTLTEPGIETDMWVGNACLTGSGTKLVVVYAPRGFTNRPVMFERGAFAAVVNLRTGAVTKLDTRVSIAYFNPGCGSGETAVLTQAGETGLGKTRLQTVDAATGKLGSAIELSGQVTSAVPAAGKIVAADGFRLISIDTKGKRKQLASTSAVPSYVRPDGDDGVVLLDHSGDDAQVKYVKGGKTRTLASGRLQSLAITSGTGGRVFVTGQATPAEALPTSVSLLSAPAESWVSSEGQLVVSRGEDKRLGMRVSQPLDGGTAGTGADPVQLSGKVLNLDKSVSFTVFPGGSVTAEYAQGRVPSPAVGVTTSERALVAANTSSSTVDAGRACSVPRNDPFVQVYQPHWKQVEWAVDNAVRGTLPSRPQNWKSSGLTAWSPQAYFPRLNLYRGATLISGGVIPPPIMLGILAQESNLWMASPHVIEGETGNPLIGNFYGNLRDGNGTITDWSIHWDKADCGYGVGQITDGMNLNKPNPLPGEHAKAVALDYATNIAAAVRILESKWNQLHSTSEPMLKINNDNTDKIENWYYAIWAYNSGYHPQAQANGVDADGRPNNGAWGLGWANNPINPAYKQGRSMFLVSQSDATHPQDWPYQEKVIGWAAYSITKTEGGAWQAGFQPAWWNPSLGLTADENRRFAIPGGQTFCLASIQCYPGESNQSSTYPNEKPGPCRRDDLKCWINTSVSWKTDCNAQCGFYGFAYAANAPEPPDAIPGGSADPFKPNCSTAGLPAGALIVDDVPPNVPAIRPSQVQQCNKATWTNSGTFSLNFPESPAGSNTYPARVDFHQLGSGFGAHQWFAYMRDLSHNGSVMNVVGTWTLNRALNSWARVLVHVPLRRAHTQQAPYKILLGNGTTKTRYLPQFTEENKWVSLGVFKFAGIPEVQLGTTALDTAGDGSDAVSWDAVAFQPLPGKPRHIVAVLGDSYTSGEGAGSYYRESDSNHGTSDWNACRRSHNAWSRKLHLYGTSADLGTLADNWSPDAELGFVACSGAQTQNVRDLPFDAQRQSHGEGQFKEQNQVNSGVLDENTTLVMLTLGGNDRGAFTSAVMACALPTDDCSKDPNYIPKYQQLADQMIPDLRLTILDIAGKAPNAQIVLMGYPELFSRSVKCNGTLYIDGPEADSLNQLANYVGTKQAQMIATLNTSNPAIKATYISPVQTFVGHAACDDPEWINAAVSGPNGDGDFHSGDPASQACIINNAICLSRESFHPKATGTSGYATVMEQALNSLGYKGS